MATILSLPKILMYGKFGALYKPVKVASDGTVQTSGGGSGSGGGVLPSATVTRATKAVDTTNQTALASNASRLGLVLFNNSSSRVFVKYGATASPTSFDRILLPGTELPGPWDGYTGRIDTISEENDATANAGVYVVELSA